MSYEKQSITSHKLNTLKAQLAKQIEGFKERRNWNRRNATLARALTILFGFGITVLLGLNVDPSLKATVSNVALVLGAGVTLLASWDAFSNYRALWLRYTFAITQLLSLRSELEYKLPETFPDITEAEIDKYYRKFQNILEETNESWRDLRKEETDKSLS